MNAGQECSLIEIRATSEENHQPGYCEGAIEDVDESVSFGWSDRASS